MALLQGLSTDIEPAKINTEEVERQIESSLRKIEEKNEILIGLKQLTTEDKLDEVARQCRGLVEEYKKEEKNIQDKHSEEERQVQSTYEKEKLTEEKEKLEELFEREMSHLSHQTSMKHRKLKQEYSERVHDYVQNKMEMKLNLKQEEEKARELLVETLFYHLVKGEQLSHAAVDIITKIPTPLNVNKDGTWCWWICILSSTNTSFARFYNLLGSNPDALQYLIYRYPQLVIHNLSDSFMNKVASHVSYDTLRVIIMTLRGEDGRTYMFYAKITPRENTSLYFFFSFLYTYQTGELFKLLSVRDNNGQTALHVNTKHITELLSTVYTSQYRNQISDLLSIRDNNNQTALDTSKGAGYDQLSWFMEQIQKNRYVLNGRMVVLIIYNTKNRRGAQEEAELIYNAFKERREWLVGAEVMIEKDKSKEEIFHLIKEAAKQTINHPISSLVVILSSHGSVGTIDDSEAEQISLKLIESVLCSLEELKNRPKILITQCCQNAQRTVDDGPPYAPTSRDFCAIMSSVAGKKSTRGVFLPKLATQIENSKSEDIFKIVSNVCQEMERENHPQTPIIMGTLKSQFCPNNSYLMSTMKMY